MFIVDSDGTLHDTDVGIDCLPENPIASYTTAAEARDIQAGQILLFDSKRDLNKKESDNGDHEVPTLTIKHFCLECLTDKSWGDLT